jgi:thiol-disulfide isomerase/thioredoxin
MKASIILVAVVLFWAHVARAEDQHFSTLKVGTEVYTNVTVTLVTATDIYFSHGRGVGNAKIKKLDPELQKVFRFDPTKAAEKEKQQEDDKSRYIQAVSQAKPAAPPGPVTEPDPASKAHPSEAYDDIIPPHAIHARPFLHRPAPEIFVQKWVTGPPDMTGKFVLVDFWATWCSPCRESIPGLNRLYSKFKDRLVIIGLSDESEETVRKMKNPRIDYYVGVDPERHSKTEVGVSGIPHALLIDPKGIVRFEGHPHYLDENSLSRLMAKYAE